MRPLLACRPQELEAMLQRSLFDRISLRIELSRLHYGDKYIGLGSQLDSGANFGWMRPNASKLPVSGLGQVCCRLAVWVAK